MPPAIHATGLFFDYASRAASRIAVFSLAIFLLSLRAAYGAEVAADNQAVVDGADLVLVCLPAKERLAILKTLQCRKGQSSKN